jgi:hypothetical protein
VLFPVTFWNDQFHPVGVFVDVSLNWTANGATPEDTFEVKLATGANTDTLMNVTVELLVPPLFVAFNRIDQLPFLNEYVMFCAVENWTLVLFPVVFWNDHDQLVGVLLEVSLNFTVRLSTPDVTFVVNDDTGGGGVTVIYTDFSSVSNESAFRARNVTVYVPGVVYR